MGYTPRISTAVWTGYPDARTSIGPAAFGGAYAAPIWRRFMSVAHGTYCGDFPQPSFSSLSGAHTAPAR